MSLIRDLHLKIEGFELNIPEWEIADQGITALTGRSGSGKTTIARILLGLDACPTLKWSFGEEEIGQWPVERRRIGVVFQNFLLFPHLTARANIEFAARARRVGAERSERKIAEWSAILGLDGLLDRRAELLSGGEQQRVSLARALIGEPRFLILDEPFSALDADLRAESRNWVRNLVQREKIPCLLISHDRQDIESLAQREFVLVDGKIHLRR